jgi:molybdopterin-binding protein
LLDEPLSSLDVGARPQIYALLTKIKEKARQIVIHVTHDYIEAARLATTVAVMDRGRIIQSGAVSDIFHHPASEFVARFAGIRNFLKGTLCDGWAQDGESRKFHCQDIEISVISHASASKGCVMIRSEDVTLSNMAISSSALNNFAGRVLEVVPVYGGTEVIVDIGTKQPLELAAMVSRQSADKLKLRKGKRIWVSFKASAIKFINEQASEDL